MDARTGLGRFRDFRVSNYQLMMELIDYCREHSIEETLNLPDVRERVELYKEHEAKGQPFITPAVLDARTILGHAIVVGGSSWTNYPSGDVGIMAESGCSVAHAVWVFARRGVLMESFALYKAAGVNLSLGTDTNPQSVIEAMRWAAVCSKVVERNTEATTAADVFDAATLGGARALGRDDLGRIAPGVRADLVLWKGRSWGMTPLRDPVKNIVYNATAEDVDRVWVNGRLVVDGGGVLAADEGAILGALQAAGDRMWPRMGAHDWAGRGADLLSPQTYQEWSQEG
jgi:cytosine/adenosine deaminase-related metal-dependent hydrolase